MKKALTIVLMMILTAGCNHVQENNVDHVMYDLAQEKVATFSEILPRLIKNRIILVGEFHNEKSHHEIQLHIIRAIFESGVPLAIGFEMFESENQSTLDKWVSGKLKVKEFKKVYYENWNFPWALYSPIFEYAKKNRIPMVGLNVSRNITRQVSQMGFKSLSQKQKGKLSEVYCRVDKEYMDFIKNAFGAHAHGELNFTYFCEAQLIWDNVMAINALEFLDKNPDYSIILITGSGHARKKGVPHQIRKRSELPYTVILPEVPGSISPETITHKDADYIMMVRKG